MPSRRLTTLRRWLHAHPDLSRREEETATYVLRHLNDHAPPDTVVPLAGAGFAAVYHGRAPGPTVLLRAELDALPISEADDLPWRSLRSGVGHKCGHDGHMAILAGVAERLVDRPACGRVVLMFQPDEETGTGARACATHPDFARIAPDFVFALHNLPGFPKGQVVCKPGVFASAVKYAAIRLSGREAHSAQPETGASPAFALAELTLAAREVQALFDRPEAYALVVPVFAAMGVTSSGVSPARGEAHFTLRAGDGGVVEAMWSELSARAAALAATAGLVLSFETLEEYRETSNGHVAVDLVRRAALGEGLEFKPIVQPFRWGEDFGELTARHEGALFGLGAGCTTPPLHDPAYDFPDDLLDTGIDLFARLIALALFENSSTAPA